jgi:hypothetical protein
VKGNNRFPYFWYFKRDIKNMGTKNIPLISPSMRLGWTGVFSFILALIVLELMSKDPNGPYSVFGRLILVIIPIIVAIVGIVRYCRE